jgi:Flp pilus assembly protein TadG
MLKNRRGQAMVEFTLCLIIMLVVAWIPADFGLAFYTAQLAGNAARDGARIAAADPTLTAGTQTCTVRVDCQTTPNSILDQAAKRVASALMPNTTVSLTLQGGTTCDRLVTVTVSGTYNYFFYQLLRMMKATAPNGQAIIRTSSMRWEHQC